MRRAALLALIAACNLAPRYRRPGAPRTLADAAQYREAARGGPWRPANPSDAMLRGAWWKIFNEPELDALMARIDVNNQNVAQAFANLMAARAQIRIAQAQYAPTVTAQPSATTGRFGGTSTSGLGAPGATSTTVAPTGGSSTRRTFYSLPLDATWTLDLFGRVRNTVAQARYNAQVSAADLENTRLVAQATLAQSYFQLRGQDALVDLLEATAKADAELLELARARFETGVDSELAVVQAEQALQAARVQVTAARVQRAQYEHAIATLIGVAATSFSLAHRGVLAAPPPIPTGTPSRLVERRPDVAAAERAMAAANAAIGIARAAYFPDVTLSGSAGFASSTLSSLLSWPSRVWSLGAAVSQTLFEGGARRATVVQARARYDAAVAGYRQTVLTAFQQVEDALAQTILLSQQIAEQRRAVELADHALSLQRWSYEQGITPYTDLMQEQLLLLEARQALVNLQIQQMTSAIALVQSLGGGWERADLPRE